jgi:hypothetical protein
MFSVTIRSLRPGPPELVRVASRQGCSGSGAGSAGYYAAGVTVWSASSWSRPGCRSCDVGPGAAQHPGNRAWPWARRTGRGRHPRLHGPQHRPIHNAASHAGRRFRTAVLAKIGNRGRRRTATAEAFPLVRRYVVGATGIEPVTSSVSVRIRSPLCQPGFSQRTVGGAVRRSVSAPSSTASTSPDRSVLMTRACSPIQLTSFGSSVGEPGPAPPAPVPGRDPRGRAARGRSQGRRQGLTGLASQERQCCTA